MNIILLGYGKMGKTIEKIAQGRGHQITHRIDADNTHELSEIDWTKLDVAIEFSQPEAAFGNIALCLKNQVPIISGTTGWLERKKEVEALCKLHNGTFFYASNYSIGVNLFFKLNQYMASLMEKYDAYDLSMEEIHHTEKKDAPSGTAITLAEDILQRSKHKASWVNAPANDASELAIISKREDEVPGTHAIYYRSEVDEIELKHTAFSRQGFALGAVLVAEWTADKKGLLNMEDFLQF